MTRHRKIIPTIGVAATALGLATAAIAQPPVLGPGSSPKFERIVIDANFPGGYQVEVADVNGDGKPDIVGVGGGTCAWYENPSWAKRTVSTPKETSDIISSATADLDGDGKAEIAIAYDFAMNEPRRGKLLLASQGDRPDAPWTFRPIADVPSIHRLRWAPILGGKKLDLVVAPIFGRDAKPPKFDQQPADVRVHETGVDPKAGRWSSRTLVGGHVTHAIEARVDPTRVDDPVLLAACAEGVLASVASTDPRGNSTFAGFDLFPIPAGVAPRRGCSEVHLGHFAGGRRFLATLEPWHGTTVAVRPEDHNPGRRNLSFGDRVVLDDTLDDGHALWVADVDGDGTDEVFAGHRGKDPRVSFYRFDGRAWARTVLDATVAAQDLRGGDLDGDGTPDIVAIGGKTHNVVWYRPIREK